MHPIMQIRSLRSASRDEDINLAERQDLFVALDAYGYHDLGVSCLCGVDLFTLEQGLLADAEAERPRGYPLPRAIVDAVERAPRGSYQRGLLAGYESWSGSSLRGAAKNWRGRYQRSRDNLVARIGGLLPDNWWADDWLVFEAEPGMHAWTRELLIVEGLQETDGEVIHYLWKQREAISPVRIRR